MVGSTGAGMISAFYIRRITKNIYLETPNPMMSRFAIAHGAKVIVDNTFIAPFIKNQLGACCSTGYKIFVRSYDVWCFNDQMIRDLYDLFNDQNTTGPTLSPLDSLFTHAWFENSFASNGAGNLKMLQENCRLFEEESPVKQVYYTGKGGK